MLFNTATFEELWQEAFNRDGAVWREACRLARAGGPDRQSTVATYALAGALTAAADSFRAAMRRHARGRPSPRAGWARGGVAVRDAP